MNKDAMEFSYSSDDDNDRLVIECRWNMPVYIIIYVYLRWIGGKILDFGPDSSVLIKSYLQNRLSDFNKFDFFGIPVVDLWG